MKHANMRGQIIINIPKSIDVDTSIELFHHIEELCRLLSNDALIVECQIK
jgi:hypothetical protein